MRNRTTFKTNRCFHFVAFFKELNRVTKFRLEIMLINCWAQTNFFHKDNLLISTNFTFFLLLLKFEFTIVHDTSNWRFGFRGNKDKIQVNTSGNFKCFVTCFDS